MEETRKGRIDELVFLVPQGKFVFLHPNGRYSTEQLVGKSGAREHLLELGMDHETVKTIFKVGDYRRAYGIDIAPGEPTLFRTTVRGDEVYINAYVPPALQPEEGEFPTIREMLAAVTDGDEAGIRYLTHWMAFKAQNPGARSMVAIVLQGGQGIGKTLLGHVLRHILGPENCSSISQNALESQFNSAYAGKLFVMADEVVDKENAITTSNKLKQLISDPVVHVNGKNVKQFEAPNRTSWWFTSNASAPVRVEGPGDRRYTVFRGLSTPTAEYRAKLAACFERNEPTAGFRQEIAAFAHSLLNTKVDVPLISRPYENEARAQVMQASRTSFEAFFEEVDDRGIDWLIKEYRDGQQKPLPRESWDYGGAIEFQTLYAVYRDWCSRNGFRSPVSRQTLGREMKLLRPTWTRKRVSTGHRPWVHEGLKREEAVWFVYKPGVPMSLPKANTADGLATQAQALGTQGLAPVLPS